MTVRQAVFSGSWYPGSASKCDQEIQQFLNDAPSMKDTPQRLVGGIVPHAGWFFSGSIACNVIHLLKDETATDTIVIFGMHLSQNSPCYIMTEGAWQTPFGDVKIDHDLAMALVDEYSFIAENTQPFTRDNTIELQLPFIKYFFDRVKIVPIGVPPVEDSLQIGRAVAEYGQRSGIRLKVIGSTDLTHYGANYGYSPVGSGAKAHAWVRNENDRGWIDTVRALTPAAVIRHGVTHQSACCAGAAGTALEAGIAMGAQKADLVAYATSYEKSPGDSFVGYAGMVF